MAQTHVNLHNWTQFDNIPTEVICNILRFVDTETLCLRHWNLLFSHGSPFRVALSTMFTEVILDDDEDKSEINMKKGIIKIRPGRIGLDDELVHEIFRVCGASVRQVYMYNVMTDIQAHNDFLKLCGFLADTCCEVNGLTIEINSASPTMRHACNLLTRGFGSQLHSITWFCNCVVNVPDFTQCTAVQRFRYESIDLSSISSLWIIFGNTLKQLSIRVLEDIGWNHTLCAIEKYCSRLAVLKLEPERIVNVVGEERFTSFLTSFGAQLLHADVNGLSNANLCEVARFCPNLYESFSYSDQDEIM